MTWKYISSSGSKENKPEDAGGPARKRRRIIHMDSDDSGDDATFEPKKEVNRALQSVDLILPQMRILFSSNNIFIMKPFNGVEQIY